MNSFLDWALPFLFDNPSTLIALFKKDKRYDCNNLTESYSTQKIESPQLLSTIRFKDKDTRKRVKTALNASIHYEAPLSANSMYDGLECRRDACTASKTASNTVLSLPIHAYLTDEEVNEIIDKVKSAYEHNV